MLLGRPPVRDIISQRKSTIEFARISEERLVLFVKLSTNLSADTKKFIGAILISEVLGMVLFVTEAHRLALVSTSRFHQRGTH
jgi:hypothetical protein